MLLTKHHGLGNDFLVALAAHNEALTVDALRAATLCDRHRGIGADGLIWALPSDRGHDIRMVLYNSDGSEAEISGNGIRCLAQAILRSERAVSGDLAIETAAGVRRVEVTATDDPDVVVARVAMGRVDDGPAVPMGLPASTGRAVGLSIGNPHLVLEVDSLDDIDAYVDGPAVEALVPGGVNVHFLTPDGTDTVRVVHWERGAGVTLACGSGAAVAAVAAHRWGLAATRVTVRMPGGDALVDVGDSVHLTGPACYVGEVIVP